VIIAQTYSVIEQVFIGLVLTLNNIVMGTQTWQVERTKKKINDLPTLFPVP
jgi:cytochrome oxidase assembly protein ShyY1